MASSPYIVTIQQNSNPAIVIEAPMPDSFAFDVGASYEQMLPQGFTDNKVLNVGAALMGTRLSVQALTAQLWAGSTDSELSMELDFHTETDPYYDVRTPIVNLLKLTMPSIDTKSGFLGSPGPYIDFTKAGVAASIITTSVNSLGSSIGSMAGTAASLITEASDAIANGLGLGTTPKPATMTETNTQVADSVNNFSVPQLQQNPTLGTAKFWNTMIKNKISISVGSYLYFDSVVITRVSQTFASNFDAQTGLPHHVRVSVSFKPLFMLAQEDLDTLFVNPAGGSTSGNNSYGFSIPNQSAVAGGGSLVSGSNQYGFTM